MAADILFHELIRLSTVHVSLSLLAIIHNTEVRLSDRALAITKESLSSPGNILL